MTRWLMACLVLIAGCASGPEGGDRRIGEPAETPHTSRAKAWYPARLRPPCLVNRTTRPVSLYLVPAGMNRRTGVQANPHLLKPGASLRLRGQAERVRFASVVDGKDPDAEISLRSRLYSLPSSPPAPACRWQIRSDPSGRLDLFESVQADDQ